VAQDVERIVGMSDENNRVLESVRSAADGVRDLAADMNHIAARFKA
jgi:methyl-accepting chemotaxis protein